MYSRNGQGKKRLRDLEFYILSTKDPAPHEIELVERSFSFWRDSWEETFRHLRVLSGAEHVYSDDFLARDALALFERGQPVALFFMHFANLRDSHLRHSYFKNYPPEVFLRLQELGFEQFMILSYMTVQTTFRKALTDIPMYELLFTLGVRRFRETNQECLIGYIRKDLSFYKSFERHGGIHLAQHHVYNVDVDYFYMTKQTACMSPLPGITETADALWEKMLFRNRSLTRRTGKIAA